MKASIHGLSHTSRLLLLAGILLSIPLHVQARQHYDPPGTRVSIGHGFLHLYCMGSGSPTVVMDSGLGGTFLDWSRVQPEVARYTRVCTYDRAGYGWSDSSPYPRTAEVITHELHTLLRNAGISGPFVLVGHSFGGFTARLFACHYPQQTAALVLVDSAHEQQVARFANGAARTNTAPRGRNIVLFSGPRVPPNMPPSLHSLAQEILSSGKARSTVLRELAAMRASAEQVVEAGPLPAVPLAVITRGMRVWPRTTRGDAMEQTWSQLQDDLALQVPRAIHLIAEHSGHYVQLDQPEVVVDTIRVLVNATRH